MRRLPFRSSITFGLLLLMFLPLPYVDSALAAARCFTEVRFCVDGQFRTYWERNGSLPVFGLPVTTPRDEYNRDAARVFQTQWFERNRFELHPENRAPYDVLLGRLGDEVLRQRGIDWASLPKANPGDPRYFSQTGHAITNEPFWQYWRGHGLDLGDRGISERESLALFGYPISEARLETNSSGDTVLTQWFERARFEYHPNNPDPYKVLLGLLGNEIIGSSGSAPLPGRIAFVRNGDLYIMNGDGSGQRKLVAGPVGAPSWSPNGQMLAFWGRDGLQVLDLDGGLPPRLIFPGATEQLMPVAWSPDSTRVVMEWAGDLYTVNVGASYVLNITNSEAQEWSPQWSPDGTRIAFMASDCFACLINADGTGRRTINGRSTDSLPIWSATGKLAYISIRNRYDYDVYVANADGSAEYNVTSSPSVDVQPQWSPDGSQLAYVGYDGLHVVAADGTGNVRLTPLTYSSDVRGMTWSPDSQSIAFVRDGQLFVISATGGPQIRLATDLNSEFVAPAWSPN